MKVEVAKNLNQLQLPKTSNTNNVEQLALAPRPASTKKPMTNAPKQNSKQKVQDIAKTYFLRLSGKSTPFKLISPLGRGVNSQTPPKFGWKSVQQVKDPKSKQGYYLAKFSVSWTKHDGGQYVEFGECKLNQKKEVFAMRFRNRLQQSMQMATPSQRAAHSRQSSKQTAQQKAPTPSSKNATAAQKELTQIKLNIRVRERYQELGNSIIEQYSPGSTRSSTGYDYSTGALKWYNYRSGRLTIKNTQKQANGFCGFLSPSGCWDSHPYVSPTWNVKGAKWKASPLSDHAPSVQTSVKNFIKMTGPEAELAKTQPMLVNRGAHGVYIFPRSCTVDGSKKLHSGVLVLEASTLPPRVRDAYLKATKDGVIDTKSWHTLQQGKQQPTNAKQCLSKEFKGNISAKVLPNGNVYFAFGNKQGSKGEIFYHSMWDAQGAVDTLKHDRYDYSARRYVDGKTKSIYQHSSVMNKLTLRSSKIPDPVVSGRFSTEELLKKSVK